MRKRVPLGGTPPPFVFSTTPFYAVQGEKKCEEGWDPSSSTPFVALAKLAISLL